MKPYDLNDHYRIATILDQDDLADYEADPAKLDDFFGPNILFRLADGTAIVQHNRPEANALIVAHDELAAVKSRAMMDELHVAAAECAVAAAKARLNGVRTEDARQRAKAALDDLREAVDSFCASQTDKSVPLCRR